VQDKLKANAASIPVASDRAVKTEAFDLLFKYMIYDGYRPQTLAHARDYLDFLIREPSDESEPPSHILEYMSQDIKTVLPNDVDESRVLDFD